MPKDITEEKIKSHLQTLAEIPQLLADYTNGLDEKRLSTPPAKNEWSAVENLAHIRSCADVWGYSIYAMLILNEPELEFIHPRDWAKMQRYDKVSFEENLQAFTLDRKNLLRKLHGLSFDQWGRTPRFSGKVNVHTIFSQVERMALHDAQHCDIIKVILH